MCFFFYFQPAIRLSLDPSVVPRDVPTIPIAIRIPKKKKKPRKNNATTNSKPETPIVYESSEENNRPKSQGQEGSSVEQGSHDVSEQQNVYYYAPPGHELPPGNQRNPSVPIIITNQRVPPNSNYRVNGNSRPSNSQQHSSGRPVIHEDPTANARSPVRNRQNTPPNYQQSGRPAVPQNGLRQPDGQLITNGAPPQSHQNQFSNAPASSPSFFLPAPDFLDNGFQSLGSPFGLTSTTYQRPTEQGGIPAQQVVPNRNAAAPALQGPPSASHGQQAPGVQNGNRATSSLNQQQHQQQQAPGTLLGNSQIGSLSPPPFRLAPTDFGSFFDGFPAMPDFGFPFLQQNFPQSQGGPQTDITPVRGPQSPGTVLQNEPQQKPPRAYEPNAVIENRPPRLEFLKLF